MHRKAIFPGSFDPLTKGHESIIKRGLEVFDEVVISIGNHSGKQYMFSVEQRLEMIKPVFTDDRISVQAYDGLTVDFAKTIGAGFILRGLRNSNDFKYERDIAFMNNSLTGIETIFLLTEPEYAAINSTIVRDIIRNNGKVHAFLPTDMEIPV